MPTSEPLSFSDRARIVAELIAPRLDVRTLGRLDVATEKLSPRPDLSPAYALLLAKPFAALIPGKNFGKRAAQKAWTEARRFAGQTLEGRTAKEQLVAALGSMEVGGWKDKAVVELLGAEPEEPDDPCEFMPSHRSWPSALTGFALFSAISLDEEMQAEFMEELDEWSESAKELTDAWEDAIGKVLRDLGASKPVKRRRR